MVKHQKKKLKKIRKKGYSLDIAAFTYKYLIKVLILGWLLAFATMAFILNNSPLSQDLKLCIYQIAFVITLVLIIIGALLWRYFDNHIFLQIKAINYRLQSICNLSKIPKGEDFSDELTHMEYQLNQLDQALLESKDLLNNYKYLNLVTNLYNYKGFIENTKSVAHSATPEKDFALIRVCIDNYKLYHSIYGPESLEELAVQIGQRIKDFETQPSYIGHITDKEFVLITQFNPNDSALTTYTNQLRTLLNTPYKLKGRSIRVTFSFGITYLAETKDIERALQQTEVALATSEQQGGNRDIYYTPKLEKPVSVVDIQAGIDNKEFYMVYQPQIDAFTGELVGFEALVRWNHPIKGFIPPDKFINVAENENLIIELGNYIIDQVFAQVQEWTNKGYNPGKVSVNTSIIQLKNIRTLRFIRTLMDKYEIKPRAIAVEITESKALEASQEIQQHLETLRSWGVLVALDDFGKEYSNLSMLTDLPIDFLKIDKAFIDDIQKNTPILTTIVDLAQKLNMRIIAEGVETEDQLERLRELKCHIIQGYFYDKPLTVEAVENKYFKK